MLKEIHVIFDGKALQPVEPVDLEPNTEYLVTIKKEVSLEKKSLWNIIDDIIGKVDGPSDWSEEHDHYLYGTPKRNQE